MKNKPLIKLSALAAMAILVAVAFVGLPTTAGDGSCDWAYEVTWTLKAGQTIEVGTVTAYVENGDIHVDYAITDTDWTLTESSVAIVAVDADDCDECGDYFPLTKAGNPKVGQFPYKSDEFTDHIYEIPVGDDDIAGDDDDGFEYGECLCIATHAVVEKGTGDEWQTQTGWAGDHDFGGKSWAVYFCFKPAKVPALPSGYVKYYISNPGVVNTGVTPPRYGCYWDTTILEGASGNVENNVRLDGWCVETGQFINGGNHWGKMTVYAGTGYHQINYIFNNIERADYSWQAFQLAIWYFALGTEPDDAEPVNGIVVTAAHITEALEIIGIADDYPTYIPMDSGDLVAVLLRSYNKDTGADLNEQDLLVFIDP